MAEVKNISTFSQNTRKFFETGEVLKDNDKSGKLVNWQAEKQKNIEVADMLATLGKDRNERVLNCGTFLEFKEKADGTKKLNRAYFCKNRLCPACNKRKAWKRTAELATILDNAIELHPTGRFIFLTLTVENAYTAEQLAREIKEINQAFGKLTRYAKLAKNLLGYVRATEITVNHDCPQAGRYHHHIHAILFVKPYYFSSGNYIKQAEYTDLWQKALKSDTPNIVNVKIVRPDDNGSYIKSAIETGKYTVKDSDYMTGKYFDDLKTLDDLTDALKGTRDIAYGGMFRRIKQELESEAIPADETDSIGSQIIQAHWYWHKSNYYVWREKTQDKETAKLNVS